MFLYKIAEANEALIITGARAHSGEHGDVGGAEGAGFKIVVGKGVWVIPFMQKAKRLGLQAHTTEISDECVTKQGIPVKVRGVVVFKVGDDFPSIANAARRFLENEADMDSKVHNVFAGHLRSIIGGMTVEEIIGERARLAEETRKSSEIEMQKLGLIIDSLQIQEVDDPSDYIKSLAAPHQAAVKAAARIAEAERNQEATAREQEAEAQNAQAVSQSQVRQAELAAASETAKQKADQAGPLAAAQARAAVVEQETHVSELMAAQTEKELQVTVVKPAQAKRDAAIAEAEGSRQSAILAAEGQAGATKVEAEAYATSTKARAQADAEATRVKGVAQGDATKATLLAEAEGLKARGEALATNQDAVIAQEIAKNLPAIIGEAVKPFGNIDQLTVLNGAEGMGDMFRQAMGLGVSILPMLREALKHDNGGKGTNAQTHDVEPPAVP